MELATICYDATGRRVYGERDMKKRGRGVARSGAEEVVEGHFGLDVSIVLSGNETVGRDKRNMKRLFTSGEFRIHSLPASHCRILRCGDAIAARTVLHFAQVDGVVIPIEHKVDLRVLTGVPVALPSPGIFSREHTGNAELELDLPDMLETKPLECKATPCLLAMQGRGRRPEVAARDLVAIKKRKMEKREMIVSETKYVFPTRRRP